MSGTKNHRWACPTCGLGVLAPSKPRKDDVRRFCLPCSSRTGRLVARTCAFLEAKRTAKKERTSHVRLTKQQRKMEASHARFTIDGVHMFDEMISMTAAPVFLGTPVRGLVSGSRITLKVRRASRRPMTRLGFAIYAKKVISITTYPGHEADHARETLLHELAHIATPGDGHGTKWKTVFRTACEQVFGVRPILESRFHGEVTRLVRAKRAKEQGLTTEANNRIAIKLAMAAEEAS